MIAKDVNQSLLFMFVFVAGNTWGMNGSFGSNGINCKSIVIISADIIVMLAVMAGTCMNTKLASATMCCRVVETTNAAADYTIALPPKG